MMVTCRGCGLRFEVSRDAMECRCQRCGRYYLIVVNIERYIALGMGGGMGVCQAMNCFKSGRVKYWHGSRYCEEHYNAIVESQTMIKDGRRTKYGWTKL